MDETALDWDSLNINSDENEDDIVGEIPPQYFKVVAKQENALPTWGSKIGGYPHGVQDSPYPKCPRCHHFMFFLAQFDYGGGLIYAFLCRDCNTCTSSYQCT